MDPLRRTFKISRFFVPLPTLFLLFFTNFRGLSVNCGSSRYQGQGGSGRSSGLSGERIFVGNGEKRLSQLCAAAKRGHFTLHSAPQDATRHTLQREWTRLRFSCVSGTTAKDDEGMGFDGNSVMQTKHPRLAAGERWMAVPP